MPAPPCSEPPRSASAIATNRRRGRSDGLRLGLTGLAAFLLLSAPAKAQLASSLSIDSDAQLRGYSPSYGRPVATLDLAFDHDSGFYANASVAGVLNEYNDVRLMAAEGSAGYAWRINSSLSVDGGVGRSQYEFGAATNRAAHYTEIFAGLTGSRLSYRVFYSPDYLRPSASTLYGEADALLATVDKVRITSHLGLLLPLSTPTGGSGRTRYDWRIAAARQIGQIELHAGVSGGGPGQQYYNGHNHPLTALTFGVSWFP